MSRGVLAWPVDIEPSWPVFMAWSMSSASPPRHSPTMIRSGRMRRELRTSSRMGMAPLPSMLGGRDSSVMTCSWRSWSSAASSMVTMRSSLGMKDERMLSIVVLPEPVPPATKMFRRASTHALRKSNISGVAVPKRMRSSTVNGDAANFRTVMTGPDQADGRDDGVDARAVHEAGVDHRAGLIDAAADGRDDAVDDAHHVVVVLERDVGQLQLAGTLDVDLARAVDHDFRDALVTQQGLERTEADDLIGDLLQHPDALGAGEGETLLLDDLAEDLLDLAPDLDLVGQVELGVQVLDDPLLDAELGVPERLPDRHLGQHPAGRAGRHGTLGAAGHLGLDTARLAWRDWERSFSARTSALDAPQQGHRVISPGTGCDGGRSSSAPCEQTCAGPGPAPVSPRPRRHRRWPERCSGRPG